MADDDDKPKKHTLDTLFLVYCNVKLVASELENTEYDAILLTQIDCWLETAKLMPKPITRTQTGLLYMRFKKWRLEYEDFLEVLANLARQIEMPLEELKQLLIEAGVPTGAGEAVVVK